MGLISYDNRDGDIWYNGKMVPWRDAKVHVLNHGLHYASSVFEGVRIYGGHIFKLTEHSERLIASAKLLDFDLPYTVQELDDATIQVCKTNNITDGYIRPIAWRGSEMMAISNRNSKTHVAIAAWEWATYFSQEIKEKGVSLTWAKWKRPSPETEPTASKAAGLYMICTMSKHSAEDAGYDDALMLDWRGYVAEATGANIFFIIDGELHTPTPDCFLDGITRRTVMDLAKKRGINIVERHIMPDEITKASEAFLTGTAAEVTPIGKIHDHTYQVGEITKQLMADYDALVHSGD